MSKDQDFLNLTRPDSKLLTWYFIQSLPTFLIGLPFLYFRYRTLEYRFDDKGIHMRWGILFRREINLTYARIQDIQVRSNFVQRWLGLANVEVQTASGSASAEMTLEGILDPDGLRDFLYRRSKGEDHEKEGSELDESDDPTAEVTELLGQMADDLKAIRESLQKNA
jgi:uncharacterized membrane protein YdbT with pleckstrin-like domain